MPTRLLREGILDSPRIEQLSELAELFYRRLMSLADDHGLYHAHPTRLRSNAYPTRIDRYTDDQVRAWRDECVAAGLVYLYRVRGVDYLQMLDWRQQVKAKPKFPAPDDPLAESVTPGAPRPPRPQSPADDDPCTTRARTDNGSVPDGERSDNDPVALGEGEGVGVGAGEGVTRARVRGAGAHARELGSSPKDWGEWASWWQQERGIETTQRDRPTFVPLASRWVKAGVTVQQMREALLQAEATAKTPIAYLPAYVDRVLTGGQAPPNAAERQRRAFLDSLTGMAGRQPDPETTFDVDATEIRTPRLPRSRG
jgi:hypothetical protein